MAFILVVVLLFSMSCRKERNDPLPTPPTPFSLEFEDVFTDKPLKMMSDYEIDNNLEFPGHIINQLGNGLVGGGWGTFFGIGKGLWAIHEYKEGNTRFDKLYDGINKISDQITILQNSLDALADQLELDVGELKQLIYTNDITALYSKIDVTVNPSYPNSLGYFMLEGKKFQDGGSQDTNSMNQLIPDATTFANGVMADPQTIEVFIWEDEIHQFIHPSIGPISDNILHTYANYLIANLKTNNLQSSKSMMSAYMLFELYFIQLINLQFQCAMVYANADYYINQNFDKYNTYYTGIFMPHITDEIEVFLNNVEYLAMNLNDYRSQPRMEADRKYMLQGLAPDTLYGNMLARSRFITNLLYDALGLPYPVMNGTVILPNLYAVNSKGNTTIDNITFTVGGKQINSNSPVSQSSKFPYTWWTFDDRSTCQPDNQMKAYRYGDTNQVEEWASTEQQISLLDDFSQDFVLAITPWSHVLPIDGFITPLYYNPLNPNETSTTQTDSNFIQFAHFAARWDWGYPFLSMDTTYNRHQKDLSPYGTADYYVDPLTNGGPCWIYFDINKQLNPYYGTKKDFQDYGYSGVMIFDGIMSNPYKKANLAVTDLQVINIQTSGDIVGSDGNVELYATTYMKFETNCMANLEITQYVGKHIRDMSTPLIPYYASNHEVLHKTTKNHKSNTYVNSISLGKNKNYWPNTGYQFNDETITDRQKSLNLFYGSWMQIVYTGTYDLN